MIQIIWNHGRPMTYRDIEQALLQASGVNDPSTRLNQSREKSFRRALHNLVKKEQLIELNSQREHRYCIHPDDDDGRFREHLNGNIEAAFAVAVAMLRRIKLEQPTTADVRAMAEQMLKVAALELMKEPNEPAL